MTTKKFWQDLRKEVMEKLDRILRDYRAYRKTQGELVSYYKTTIEDLEELVSYYKDVIKVLEDHQKRLIDLEKRPSSFGH